MGYCGGRTPDLAPARARPRRRRAARAAPSWPGAALRRPHRPAAGRYVRVAVVGRGKQCCCFVAAQVVAGRVQKCTMAARMVLRDAQAAEMLYAYHTFTWGYGLVGSARFATSKDNSVSPR